ncbi:hypothetical protein BDB00DRAFT_740956, partial [Zychaea mexicana]|uniref:uncharacterized protein n=1 Tax=Zychaea mexicana TaxID=64656 RepID=UPI0022FE7632
MFGRTAILPPVSDIRPPVMRSHNTETWVTYLNHYIPVIQGQIRSNIQKAQERQKRNYDKK